MSKVTKFIDNRQFHKRNYDKALEYIIPKLYFESDYEAKDNQLDTTDKIINSHLNIIKDFNSIINISAVAKSTYSSINTPDGISQFFVKQNNLTDININDFERKFLVPLNKSMRDFPASSDFSNYLTETFLPGTRLNKPTLDFLNGAAASANHNYLITNLSWLYFLNLGSPIPGGYNPSSYVHDILVEKIYLSNNIYLNDGIKGLTEYIWKNYSTCAALRSKGYLPDDYLPPQYTVSNIYTSGTQQLDRLKTLVDVVYSPLYIDNGDTRVKDAVEDFLQNGYKISQNNLQGPFIDLIKAMGYSFADYSNNVDLLETLYDIDRCPDEFLPQLAHLLGWRLFGSEPDRWRLQLANAVSVYKRMGTKQAIQFAADSVFAQDVFDVSSKIYELWESYVPHLIYYALATESVLLKDFNTWDRLKANSLEVDTFNPSSMDENVKLCTDQIILQLVNEYSGYFFLNGVPFAVGSPEFTFNYRGRTFPVPPFEEYPYYVDTHISNDMIDSIADKLVCFGVPQSFALEVADYIRNNTIFAFDSLRVDNRWLMFTSGAEYPPNWEEVIKDITNKKSEYLPLWNGKSSHFKLLFEASSFNFAKTSLEVDSKEALIIAAQIVNEFSPAHAVPDVIADLSSLDDYNAISIEFPYIGLDKIDYPHLRVPSGAAQSQYGMSALYMGTYKRGIASSLPPFARGEVDCIADPLLSPSGTTAILPRRAHRRRNFKFTLPKEGFYTKTGFNSPAPLNPYQDKKFNYSFFPLGLIPSAQCYISIEDYFNIPRIYDRCENLNSSSIYSGLEVSNTFPIRGLRQDRNVQKVVGGS